MNRDYHYLHSTTHPIVLSQRVAHVVFVGKNIATLSRPLGKVMQNQTFNSINMQDGSPETALDYSKKRLKDYENIQLSDEELSPYMDALGGRLVDLEQFVQKVLAGQSPEDAMNDLVERAASEIRKVALGEEGEMAGSWSPAQYWHILKLLSKHDMVSYDAIRQSPLFKDPADAEIRLEALERADLLQVIMQNGRAFALAPGKPLHRAAFKLMMMDTRFVARMETLRLGELRKAEQAKVEKYETELERLNSLYTGIGTARVGGEREVRQALDGRVRSLAALLGASGAKIDDLDRDIKMAKSINAEARMTQQDVDDHEIRLSFQ